MPLPQLKHAILAQTVVLDSESHLRFEALLEALLFEHRPITVSERALVETMAAARWRQMRTWSLQKTDFDLEIALQDTAAPARVRAAIAFRDLANNGRSLDTAHRLETSYDRQFIRAIRDLALLKANRDDATILASAELTADSNAATSTWDAERERELEPEPFEIEKAETEDEAREEHDQPPMTPAAPQPTAEALPTIPQPRDRQSNPTPQLKKPIFPLDPVPISEHRVQLK